MTIRSCTDCGATLDERPDTPITERLPCPSCGSKRQSFRKELSDDIGFHSGLRYKGRHGESEQPFVEGKAGDDLHRDSDEWNTRDMQIDHENEVYHERIVNPRTGEVIKDVTEPLTQHQGHGSAKNRKKQAS